MSLNWDALHNELPKNETTLVSGNQYKLKVYKAEAKKSTSGKDYIRITARLAEGKGPFLSVNLFYDEAKLHWLNNMGKLLSAQGTAIDSIILKLQNITDPAQQLVELASEVKSDIPFYADVREGQIYEGKQQWEINPFSITKHPRPVAVEDKAFDVLTTVTTDVKDAEEYNF